MYAEYFAHLRFYWMINSVYICQCTSAGDANSFGGNRKENAVLLYTTPQSYPIWTCLEPLIVNCNKVVTYRYGIWEQGECNLLEHSLQYEVSGDGAEKSVQKLKNRTLIATGHDLIQEDEYEIPRLRGKSFDEMELIAQSKGMVATNSQDFKTTINQLTSDSKSLFLVCFHLPLVVTRSCTGNLNEFDITWAESLIAKTQGSVSEGMMTWWVGTISVPGDPLTQEEREKLKQQLYDMRCIAIFLDPQVHHDTYKGYCKQIMW